MGEKPKMPLDGEQLGRDWCDPGTLHRSRTCSPALTGSNSRSYSPLRSWKPIELDDCTITTPYIEPCSCAAPAIVLYGGIDDCEGAWFLRPDPKHKPELRIPRSLLQRVYFILPKHHRTPETKKAKEQKGSICGRCIAEFKGHPHVNPKSVTSYSLCGFSAGGYSVYSNLGTEDWKFIGLIDAVPPEDGNLSVLDTLGDCVRGVYNLVNWPGAEILTKFIPHLIVDLGVNMIEEGDVANNHLEMPYFFFTEYGCELAA